MRAVAGLGFDGIDLGYYWSEDKRAQEMKDAKKLAEDLQLKLTNYICGNNFGQQCRYCQCAQTEKPTFCGK